MLALEKAKQKVLELQSEKKPAFTVAKSTKGSRIAHTSTAKSFVSVSGNDVHMVRL